MKFSKLYDKAALEAAKARVVEVIELEREERDNLERIQKFLDKAKKQQKIFVQNGPCYQIDQKLPPCHE